MPAAPDLVPSGLIERNKEGIAAGRDDEAVTIQQGVLADVPARRCRGMYLIPGGFEVGVGDCPTLAVRLCHRGRHKGTPREL